MTPTAPIGGTLLTKGEVIPAKGHDFSDWTVSKEATCTEAGQETRTCERCQEMETREIPAKGHDYKVTVVEPTCEEEGYTLHECTVCGHAYRDEFVDASGMASRRFGTPRRPPAPRPATLATSTALFAMNW